MVSSKKPVWRSPTLPGLALVLLTAQGYLLGAESPPVHEHLKRAAAYSAEHHGQAVIVLFDGEILLEEYAGRGGPEAIQMLASGTKSFVGLAAAAAVQDGVFSLDDPASESLTEWQNDLDKSRITYRQLLNLTSGLTAGGRGLASAKAAWEEIIQRPLGSKPGNHFGYGAQHLNAFALALQRQLDNESFEAYLKRRILDPIGIELDWKVLCADGHPQVGGGAFTTARDWATFGELIRHNGQWNGNQIVDAATLEECFKGSSANPAYGLTWWLKTPVTPEQRRKSTVLSHEWGDVANADWLPDDLVAACGAGKQRLYVIPSQKLVVVRMGALGRGFSDITFLAHLTGITSEESHDDPDPLQAKAQLHRAPMTSSPLEPKTEVLTTTTRSIVID